MNRIAGRDGAGARDRAGAAGHSRRLRSAGDGTEGLAAFVSGLAFRHLPKQVVERAKDLVLDHLGVTLYGAQFPWSGQVRAIALTERGAAQSTIYGFGRVPMRAAALVNGAAGHAIEYDDTHDESLSHPGCVVIPAALAVAEARAANGRDVLAAIVAGYDAQCRVGRALARELQVRGWHPTATCGVYGAAAAAGRILGSSPRTVVSAFGSALGMASGVMQFTQDPEGTAIKRLHAGLPAERGVFAALLADAGFAGPRDFFEGRFGFAPVFAGVTEPRSIVKAPGQPFEIERITVKLYSCCKLFHSLIEAIAACRAQRAFGPEDVVAIQPFGPKHMIDTHMERRPESMMAAQYSLPCATAAAIAFDPADAGSFTPQRLAGRAARRIVDMVDPVVDPALDALFPRVMPGGVRIRLRDGTELAATVIESLSSPDRPIGRSEIQAKFVSLTRGILSDSRQSRIVEAAARIDRMEDIGDLTRLVRGVMRATRG